MTLLEPPTTRPSSPEPAAHDDEVARYHSMSFLPSDVVIDLNENRVVIDRQAGRSSSPATAEDRIVADAPTARLRGLRLASVAKLASVFFAVAFVATLVATVLLWLGAVHLGLIDQVEELATNALGLERFEIAGASLLGGVALLVATACALGFALTLLLAVTYNLAASLVGGLAVDLERLDSPPASEHALV